MVNHIWIERTLVAGLITWLLATATASWEGQARKASFDVNIFAVIAVLAADVDDSRLGRDSGRSNNNTWDSDQVRDIGGIQISNRDMGGRGVQKKLVGGKGDVPLAGVDDSSSAVLQRQFKLLWVSKVGRGEWRDHLPEG